MMQRRCPPSSAFKRLTAWSVVPEPAKKSIIRASGFEATKKRIASCSAYSDFGNENLEFPMILAIRFVPFAVASCETLFQTDFAATDFAELRSTINTPFASRPVTIRVPSVISFNAPWRILSAIFKAPTSLLTSLLILCLKHFCCLRL